VVKLNHFYHPEELIEALKKFVENYNNKRYHESLENLTPADCKSSAKSRHYLLKS